MMQDASAMTQRSSIFTATTVRLAELRSFLHKHLLESVVPFWERHAIDPGGGINVCLNDDGTRVSRDKWMWSQWRAVWLFSALYHRIERRALWLDHARHIYQFVCRHGWLEREQGWALRLGGDGAVIDGHQSIYVDGFAMYGLTEFLRASGHSIDAESWVRRTADSVLIQLHQPHDRIPHAPYPVPPGARVHGLPMMFSLCFWELGRQLGEPRYRAAALALCDEIFGQFYKPRFDLIVERISADGGDYPPPQGTAVVPGHAIEDMWFQIHIARESGQSERIRDAVRLIRRHCEAGWDGEYGGLYLAIDAEGRRDVAWNFADAKLWWPQTEAMYALLLAYEHSRESWCLDWYWRVHDFAFRHYPVPEHGEWRQRLDRQCRPFSETVAFPVKDPFHLPRVLILALGSLDRILK